MLLSCNPVSDFIFLKLIQLHQNVLWCQVHSPHIHAIRKASLNYNIKHPGKKTFINKYMRNAIDIKLLSTVLIKAVILMIFSLKKWTWQNVREQTPVPNKPYGFCGRNNTMK